MKSLMPAAGPPLFLVPPGGLTAGVMTLDGPEGHHAAAVRRLRAGERADVTDGAGTLAECVVTAVGKDSVTLDVRTLHAVPPPRPRLAVAQALPKGDRGELAVETPTRLGPREEELLREMAAIRGEEQPAAKLRASSRKGAFGRLRDAFNTH